MCRNSELYALHQRQLVLRKEQQQKSLSANTAATAAGLSSSTGILLGATTNTTTNSPSGGVPSNVSAGGSGAEGSGNADGGFNMMSPAEMDFQAESPTGDSKAGISMADDEGGGSANTSGETKSLLTSKGLQPSYNDLDHLFDDNLMGGCDDNSNDESVSIMVN